jgi:hypothetical protein
VFHGFSWINPVFIGNSSLAGSVVAVVGMRACGKRKKDDRLRSSWPRPPCLTMPFLELHYQGYRSPETN